MNYTKKAQSIDKKLKTKGQLVTVTRYAPSRNSATGAVEKGIPTKLGTAYAVEVPVTAGLIQSFTAQLAPGTLTIGIRRALKVSALLGFMPEPQDEVTLENGTVWPVVGCTEANPAGVPLVYTVGLSK